MEPHQLDALAKAAGLPASKFFDAVPSTQAAAQAWADEGAEDGSLVLADKQTAGRGRGSRQWVTIPGVALAFSLVLRPAPQEVRSLALLSPLCSLAVCQALKEDYGLDAAQIKWPNDVLIGRKKTAGILVETSWLGAKPGAVIAGIGINVKRGSVPDGGEMMFPATCLEEALGRPVERMDLLARILRALQAWRPRLNTPEFFAAWEERLAFKGETVTLEQPGLWTMQGVLLGVNPDGHLRLLAQAGNEMNVAAGDLHLRPSI